MKAAQAPADERKLIGERVYEQLENDILTGALPGGARLRVRELAARVGTSMLPVRDAINRLEAVGLAEHMPYRGATVKSFRASELLEVFEVRSLLEGRAAFAGAELLDEQGLDEMRTASERSTRALAEDRLIEALAHDTEMTRVLYRAAGNSVLLETIESLWKKCHLYRLIAFRNAFQHADFNMRSAQQAVLLAASAHDAAAARDATLESIEQSKRAIALSEEQ